MPIRILPSDVISKIAAGEVIERPASVVKELVENALDAGATQIAVESQDGGIELIRVIDNGSGIPRDELEVVCQRHATSKIASTEDLEHINTLGFRGEALASISAVAELDILTRAAADAAGTFISFRKGHPVDRESRARNRGTTITMHYLFRHFPARLKFLKSPATENGHISQVVIHYALAYPEVRFILHLDSRLVLRTPGSGNIRASAAEVYGVETASKMLAIDGASLDPGVTGLASPPAVFRSNRNYVSFFINRRWIRSPLLLRAVDQAYQGWLTSDKHPIVIAGISISPQDIDVNVHPRKAEVKFRNEPLVFSAVEKALKLALGIAPVSQMPAGAMNTPPATAVLPGLPGAGPGASLDSVTASSPAPLWQTQPESNALPILRVVGQMANAYIIAEGPDGLYLIDQHAAHERILYEKVLAQNAGRSIEVQGLLEPATIVMSPRQEESWRTGAEHLARFGFNIDEFGNRTYRIRSVPAVVRAADPERLVIELLDSLTTGEAAPAWKNRIAQGLACHGAIKAGQPLSHEEMRELIRELEHTRRPYTCPHGRPSIVHLNSRQLEKQFGRG